ncbi:MAG TPA: glutathione peroxidase [Segetibacter sp.]|jgi:glutathione peroxidase
MRRKILGVIYPLLVKAGKWFGIKAGKETNIKNVVSPVSFYSLKATANNDAEINFENFKGKKVLIVNTASDCGYTYQYSDLKVLDEWFKEDLQVIAFPANDFKEQEKNSDKEIAAFCSLTFGIKFLIAKKSSVVKGKDQNPVFDWLTNKEKNGWNEKQPEWNFAKYLIDENGVLTHYFGPGISPTDQEVIEAMGLTKPL